MGSFPAQTGVGTAYKVFSPLDRFVRAQWAAPTGTSPSFTFNLTGRFV